MSSAIGSDSDWSVSLDPVPPPDYDCMFSQGIEIDGKPIACPPKKQYNLDRFCSRQGVGKTYDHWKVPKDLRINIDNKLKKYISSYIKKEGSYKLENLNSYARQYLGYHSKDKKKVYINVYKIGKNTKELENNDFVWWTCHGGTNFWGIVYDTESKTFESLSVNNFGPPVRPVQN